MYMYKQNSIVNTGNFNAYFKLLTHNRYSVLNGHFVRQIHLSSFTQSRSSTSYSMPVRPISCYILILLFSPSICRRVSFYTCTSCLCTFSFCVSHVGVNIVVLKNSIELLSAYCCHVYHVSRFSLLYCFSLPAGLY